MMCCIKIKARMHHVAWQTLRLNENLKTGNVMWSDLQHNLVKIKGKRSWEISITLNLEIVYIQISRQNWGIITSFNMYGFTKNTWINMDTNFSNYFFLAVLIF